MVNEAKNCCHRCQQFNSCIEKWLRGERREPSPCCEKCQNYAECNQDHA